MILVFGFWCCTWFAVKVKVNVKVKVTIKVQVKVKVKVKANKVVPGAPVQIMV